MHIEYLEWEKSQQITPTAEIQISLLSEIFKHSARNAYL